MIRQMAAVAILMAGPAMGQSFDCAKAGTAIEKEICNNPVIGALDTQMAAAYDAARKGADSAGKAQLLAAQRTWLASRDQCAGKDAECLITSYTGRIEAMTELPGVFPGWTGSFRSWSGVGISIRKVGDGFDVRLSGAGENYTCDGRGTGHETDAGLVVTEGSTSITIAAFGTGILLGPDVAQNSDLISCGAGAPQISGSYARQ